MTSLRKSLMKAAVVISLLAKAASLVQAETITVYPYAGDGPANLVSNAIPFKPGALLTAANIRVLDGPTEVPVAVKVLAYWPQDNSIRSVLVQFSAPFTSSSKIFNITFDTSRTTADRNLIPVTWSLPARIFTMSVEYLSDSLFAGEQKPLGQTGYSAWDQKQLNYYSRINGTISASTTCANLDQYYDSISSNYQLYARTGELRFLMNGRRWALHHRRDQIWLSGPNIGHPRCSTFNTRYTFPQGLVLDYFMFGDEEAKRVSGLVVDDFYLTLSDSYYYKAPFTRGFWTEREAAFAMIGILAHFQVTNDSRYLNEARRRFTLLHQMQLDNGRRAWVHNLYDHDPTEGCSPSDWGSSPWMSGMLLESIITYHKLTNDPMAQDSIVMALDDLMARDLATRNYAGKSFIYLGCPNRVDGQPDLDNLISHAYAYGYKLTGNPDYRRVATDIFNTSVQLGVTNDAKHYNQQFRSSGLLVGYMASDSSSPTVTINQAAGQADPTSTSSINFTVVFSEPVSVFSNNDVMLGGTAGATTATVTGSGASYNVAVSGMTQSGSVIASIAAGVANDTAGNSNVASASSDNTVTYQVTTDTTRPAVTINQASGQTDPTTASPVNFTVVFSESVSDFTTGDVTLSGTAGAAIATVTGSGANYYVAVSGMTSSGTVVATIAGGVANDAAGNPNLAATNADNSIMYQVADTTRPTVTINQASVQADPTSASPINFTVIFSEPVNGFATGDVTLGGTSGATTASVTGSGATYNVTVSGMTASGGVVVSIAAGVAADSAGNTNTASTSADNTITYQVSAPPAPIALVQSNSREGKSVTSLSTSFGRPNTAGNLIIVFVRMATVSQTLTISDTRGNVYVNAVSQTQTSDGHQAKLFYARNIGAGLNALTVQFSAANANPWMAIYEYRGLSTTNPLDQTAGAQGNSSRPSVGPLATTNSNELVFVGVGLSSTAFRGSLSAGSGFTLLQQGWNAARAGNEAAIVSPAGQYTGTFNLSSTGPWTAVMATFRAP